MRPELLQVEGWVILPHTAQKALCMPPPGDTTESYLAFCKGLPEDSPDIYGQSPYVVQGLDTTATETTIQQMWRLMHGSDGEGSQVGHAQLEIKQLLEEILEIPEVPARPEHPGSPVQEAVKQEVARHNTFLRHIRSTLEGLMKAPRV